MDVEADAIRVPPKPFSRPSPSAIFEASPQLNLTPEKPSLKRSSRKNIKSQDEENEFIQGREIKANDRSVSIKAYDKLGQPSVNSTAIIASTLTLAQQQKFNAASAVKEELKKSEATRMKISEKVAQTVNVKKNKKIYSELVPVDVNQDEILSAHTVARIPRKPKKASDIPEPDIMDFFSEHFEEETADFDFGVLNDEEPLPKPSPAPMDHAFDLYHHMECWEPPDNI